MSFTSHAGRDALVGIGLFDLVGFEGNDLQCFAGHLRFQLGQGQDGLPLWMWTKRWASSRPRSKMRVNGVDRVVDLEHGWVHLRKSNTEPIIRIYAEPSPEAQASG